MPKLDTKEVKRLNEQFRVWEERFPDVSKAIKAHARTMGVEDVGKGNSFALSRANMSASDITKAKRFINWYTDVWGTVRSMKKQVREELKQSGKKPTAEDVETVINLTGNRNEMIREIFKSRPSTEAYAIYKAQKDMSTADAIQFLQPYLNPDNVYTDVQSYQESIEELMQREYFEH